MGPLALGRLLALTLTPTLARTTGTLLTASRRRSSQPSAARLATLNLTVSLTLPLALSLNLSLTPTLTPTRRGLYISLRQLPGPYRDRIKL